MFRWIAELGDGLAALTRWRGLVDPTRQLFAEPSPAPVKHALWRLGPIDSAGAPTKRV